MASLQATTVTGTLSVTSSLTIGTSTLESSSNTVKLTLPKTSGTLVVNGTIETWTFTTTSGTTLTKTVLLQ